MSEVGVQQEDPFGSLLFAMGLQPILIELKNKIDLDCFFAYEDDIILAGNVQDVAKAFEFLKIKGSEIDLNLRPNNCKLVLFSQQAYDLTVFPHDRVIFIKGVFEYLGAPIGSKSYCTEYILSKIHN